MYFYVIQDEHGIALSIVNQGTEWKPCLFPRDQMYANDLKAPYCRMWDTIGIYTLFVKFSLDPPILASTNDAQPFIALGAASHRDDNWEENEGKGSIIIV